MELNKFILAIITSEPDKVSGGGTPVFISRNIEEQDNIATILARVTEGVIHDLGNGVYILIKH